MTLFASLARIYTGMEDPATLVPPGEAIYYPASGIQQGKDLTVSYNFWVPEDVYFISAVVVSLMSRFSWPPVDMYWYYRATEIRRANGTLLLSTNMDIGSGGVGGGNGGRGGGDTDRYTSNGGGGAGGYTGNGGDGRSVWDSNSGNGGNGSGGGGGGGGAPGAGTGSSGISGGGVGLFGQFNNGLGGYGAGTSNPTPAGHGSVYQPPYVGAGLSGGMPGGDLRWLNNIPVVPGEVLTISMVAKVGDGYTPACMPGARIMWGGGRSFPNNAYASVPKGQKLITGENTTMVIPPGVTSICVACQQQDGSKAAVDVVVNGSVACRAAWGDLRGDVGYHGGEPGTGSAGGGGGGGGAAGFKGWGGRGGDSVRNTGDPSVFDGYGGYEGTGDGGKGGDGYGSYKQLQNTPVFGGSPPNPTYSYYSNPEVPGRSNGIGGDDNKNGLMGGATRGVRGGCKAYKNNISVTPGSTITINAAGGRVRIMWGPDRDYPDRTADV